MELPSECSSRRPEEDGAHSQCSPGEDLGDDEFGDPGPSLEAIDVAASLVTRCRECCGKPPCGWSLRFWDAERSCYADGGSEGSTPCYVHDESGWYSWLMPEEISWEGGGRKTWSQIAVEKMWRERCFPESDCYFRFRRSGKDRLVACALPALQTSAQQWEDLLSGSAHVDLPQLLLWMLGPCIEPSFLGKVVDMPWPVQRQIELFLGSEIVTLLSDARALVECFGLDTLAEELGTQLERALDLWQAELQVLVNFMPRVIVQMDFPAQTMNSVQCLVLRADFTFAHASYSQTSNLDIDGDGTRGCSGRASVEEGTWIIHRGSEHLKRADRPFQSMLTEGSVILEGRSHVVYTENLEIEEEGAEEVMKRVIGCGELREWAEEGHARAQDVRVSSRGNVALISYLPTFADALEDYLWRSFEDGEDDQDFCTRLRRHIADLRHFFRAEC